MDLITGLFVTTIIATTAFGLVLVKHILFKRELLKLKADMKSHTLQHGIDHELWNIFVTRTRKMLRFWQ
jgi:hypothetical protein